MLRTAGFIILLSFVLTSCNDYQPSQLSDCGNDGSGNDEVNCLKIDYGVSDSELIERVSTKDRMVDLLLLKRVHLPANASACQKKDFIDAILYLSSNQRSYIETDPQVTMIATALKGSEKEFLSMAKPNWHSPNSYIADAYIQHLGKHQMKGFVRNHLELYPWLIEVVTQNNWSAEFKQDIARVVEAKNGNVNYHFATAFKQINDPAMMDLVMKSFINGGNNRHVFYSKARDISWLDTEKALKTIWQSPNVSGLEQQYFAYPLGIGGYVPVLDYLASQPDAFTYNNPYRKNVDFFNYLTNQQLSAAQIKDWWLQNRDQVVFDEITRKFVLP